MVGENVIEMSNHLISKFGLLTKLFDSSLNELQEIKGIGQNKAMQILAIAELGKRYDQEKNSIKKITCAEDVFKLFHTRLKNKKQEHFYILMLSNQNDVLQEQEVSKGTLYTSVVDSREIFKPVIKNSVAKIILIHNHPSGNPIPSEEDLLVTEKLVNSGELLQIKVLDHVIIGRDSCWSWKENC